VDNEIIRRNTNMAYNILSEAYGRILPKITAEADSTDDLASLGTDYAEGSTCRIGAKTYTLDEVQGWTDGSGGGGGAGVDELVVAFTVEPAEEGDSEYDVTCDKTFDEVYSAIEDGKLVRGIAAIDGEIVQLYVTASYSDGETDGYVAFYPFPVVDQTSVDTYSINLLIDDTAIYNRQMFAGTSNIYLIQGNDGWELESMTWEQVNSAIYAGNPMVRLHFNSDLPSRATAYFAETNIDTSTNPDTYMFVFRTVPTIDPDNESISNIAVTITPSLESLDVETKTLQIGK
jgi:hypothetical protein